MTNLHSITRQAIFQSTFIVLVNTGAAPSNVKVYKRCSGVNVCMTRYDAPCNVKHGKYIAMIFVKYGTYPNSIQMQ